MAIGYWIPYKTMDIKDTKDTNIYPKRYKPNDIRYQANNKSNQTKGNKTH